MESRLQMMRSYADFESNWKDGGEQRGVEHRVYFDPENERYFKLTNRPNNNSWVEFFQRMQIHNTLFPETAYRLEGVAFSPRGELFGGVSPDIRSSSRAGQKAGQVGLPQLFADKALGLLGVRTGPNRAFLVSDADLWSFFGQQLHPAASIEVRIEQDNVGVALRIDADPHAGFWRALIPIQHARPFVFAQTKIVADLAATIPEREPRMSVVSKIYNGLRGFIGREQGNSGPIGIHAHGSSQLAPGVHQAKGATVFILFHNSANLPLGVNQLDALCAHHIEMCVF